MHALENREMREKGKRNKGGFRQRYNKCDMFDSFPPLLPLLFQFASPEDNIFTDSENTKRAF